VVAGAVGIGGNGQNRAVAAFSAAGNTDIASNRKNRPTGRKTAFAGIWPVWRAFGVHLACIWIARRKQKVQGNQGVTRAFHDVKCGRNVKILGGGYAAWGRVGFAKSARRGPRAVEYPPQPTRRAPAQTARARRRLAAAHFGPITRMRDTCGRSCAMRQGDRA
jgi:hypothetical protein